MAKQVNYTPEQTQSIVELYTSGATVEAIAEQFGKTTRSIVAKLSREGVYKKSEKAAQGGTKAPKKSEMVEEMANILGVDYTEIQSIEKGSKEAVEEIYKFFKKQTQNG